MSRVYACLAIGTALLALVLTGGCGGDSMDVVKVSGRVTLDGEPIENGTITFVAADGETPTAGSAIKDGTYTVNVPPGEKVVLVLGNKLSGQEPLYEGVPDSPMRDTYEMITPEGYNATRWTPLKANITEPRDDLDFDLDSSFSIR